MCHLSDLLNDICLNRWPVYFYVQKQYVASERKLHQYLSVCVSVRLKLFPTVDCNSQ